MRSAVSNERGSITTPSQVHVMMVSLENATSAPQLVGLGTGVRFAGSSHTGPGCGIWSFCIEIEESVAAG